MQTYPIKIKNTAKTFPSPFTEEPKVLKKIRSHTVRYLDSALHGTVVGIYSTGALIKQYAGRASAVSSEFDHKKIKQRALWIITALLIVEAGISFNFFKKYSVHINAEEQASVGNAFSPFLPPLSASGVRSSIPVGANTASLASFMDQQGFSALPWRKVHKAKLSMEGTLITLGNDSISVFEYPNADEASAEASVLVKKYNSTLSKNTWAEQIHLYTKGTLVIYYLGTKQPVADALSAFAGDSLTVMPAGTKTGSLSI